MADFNSKCPECGSRAYVGLSKVECLSPSCRFSNGTRLVDPQCGDPWMVLHDKRLLSAQTLLEKMGIVYEEEKERIEQFFGKPTDPRPMEQWD